MDNEERHKWQARRMEIIHELTGVAQVSVLPEAQMNAVLDAAARRISRLEYQLSQKGSDR